MFFFKFFQSIAINIKDPKGAKVVRKVVTIIDVFVTLLFLLTI